MKNAHVYTIIAGMIAIVIVSVIASKSFFVQTDHSKMFVTSEYSKYCYLKGTENGNIKTKIFYQTLQSCGKPLK